MDYDIPEQSVSGRRLPGLGVLAGVALGGVVLGALLLYLVLGSPPVGVGDLLEVRREAPATLAAPVAAVSTAALAAPQAGASEARTAVEAAARVEQQQGGLDQRIVAMEQRITRLDLQAQAAAGNAARAEGLLIAFATRRAVERGAPLGYLADQLKLRFGDAQPRAVQTIIDSAQMPVLLDQLLARLDGLAPRLHQPPKDESTWSWLARELRGLFVVRREDAPSPAIDRRLERARLFLESGRADAAAAEVRMLPNATEARDWIADAERYAAVQRALEQIETAAVLERRDLRDGTGKPVEPTSAAIP